MRPTLTPLHRRIACQSRLFSSLPPEIAARLLDTAHVKKLRRGQALFHHGDTAHSIHIVTEGWVKLYRIAPRRWSV